jgi:hypothetical protein
MAGSAILLIIERKSFTKCQNVITVENNATSHSIVPTVVDHFVVIIVFLLHITASMRQDGEETGHSTRKLL